MMWGIRATRVGFLLAGILATVAATGCCSDCCKKLWSSDKPAPMPVSQSSGQPGATSNKAADGGQLNGTVERVQGKIN